MYDIIIKNGTIIDGSGKPKFLGDVGIREGMIAEIGNLKNEHGETEIDAKGKYVAPGFIDVNNHSDTYWRIFSDPQLESLLYQGVTTIIGGNCGSSLAPLTNQEVMKSIQKWTDIGKINFNWHSMKEFLAEIEKRKLAVNFGSLVGHGTLRRGLVGDETRNINPEEIRVMKKMLTQALKEGALGFSTGLAYTHAKLASSQEIAELAEIVKKYDGVYASHIRGEGSALIQSVKEAIRVAQHSQVRLQISHLKALGEKNWHLMAEAIDLIETAHASGIDVNFDVYPYTQTGSVLYISLPDWVTEGGRDMMLARLKDEGTRARVIEEMKKSEHDYSKMSISISALDKTLNRKKIADIAKAQEKSVEDVIVDVLIASGGRVVTMAEALNEKNVDGGIMNPFSIISSNGSGYDIEHEKTGEVVHPRNFGTFPRVLAKYVRERGVIGWEEAIRKMSGLPAEKFKIEKRGLVEKGNYADIVVFDPEKICDEATYENPYKYASGVEWVLVNGKTAMEKGVVIGKFSGEVIRRKSPLFEF